MDGINYFPLRKDIADYSGKYFYKDLLAAISLALLALPQSIAYAFAANLPMSAGIFAAIFGMIFTASFGFSRFLVAGPTFAVAILIQSGVADILWTYYPSFTGKEREALALDIVLQITLVVGILQIIVGTLKLGKFTRFASRSVVIGYSFVAAAAILITQGYYFLGIPKDRDPLPLYQQGFRLLSELQTTHFPTLIVALISLILFFVFRKFSRRVPGIAIVFIIAILGGSYIHSIDFLQDFNSKLFDVHFPFVDLRLFGKILPLAFAVTLLSLIETTAIGRLYQTPYSENQEIYGLGMGNFLSSFFGAMPISGSISRTFLNIFAGAKTRLSIIFSGIIIFILIALFGFVLIKIPLATLSALMIYTAFTMVNYKELKVCLRTTKSDAITVAITFIAGMIFTLEAAVYIGIALAIIFYLNKASSPYLVEYAFNKMGKLRPIKEDKRTDPRVCIIHVEGELFFGAAEDFETSIRRFADEEKVKVIILQMINARNVDASICFALKRLYNFLRHKDGYLLLSGVTKKSYRTLERANLVDKFGKESIFPANSQAPGQPTRDAYSYAKQLLNKN